MVSYSISMYPLIEHSYTHIPEYLRAKVNKLPTLTILREKAGINENEERYYSCSSKIGIEALQKYLKFSDEPLLSDTENIGTKPLEAEFKAQLVTILKEYITLLKRLYADKITEERLNTHRIFTEYFGAKLITHIRSFENQNFIDSSINFIYSRLELSYRIFFIELLIFCKTELLANKSSVVYRSGSIKDDLAPPCGKELYEAGTICKYLNNLWCPLIKMPESILPLKDVLMFYFIPPLVFPESDISWDDRFANFRRNLSVLGKVSLYRTDYLPLINTYNIDTSKEIVQHFANYLNDKIAANKQKNVLHHNIIIGWSSSASLALQLCAANPYKVKCIILINMPTLDPLGNPKGISPNILKNIRCPIFFISGTNSMMSKSEHIETYRNSFRCPTGFLRVYNCDDMLNMSFSNKLEHNLPQDIIDIKIIERIRDFVQHFYLGETYKLNPHELEEDKITVNGQNSETQNLSEACNLSIPS